MNDLPRTRQSLLLNLRARSDDAWTEFLELYERAIYDFSRRKGLQDADARDVTQEVLAAVDHKIKASWTQDDERGRFRAWLFRVARNIAVDKYHEAARRARSLDTGSTGGLSEIAEAREEESLAFWIEYRRALMERAAAEVKPQVSEQSWQAFSEPQSRARSLKPSPRRWKRPSAASTLPSVACSRA